MGDGPDPAVTLVGLHGGRWFGDAAGIAVDGADVVFGAPRHLDALPPDIGARRVALSGPLVDHLVDARRRAGRGEHVVIVTSGDPGFFGLARLAAEHIGADRLTVHPAPSSVSLAFARLGESWDDARVVSAHGRPLDAAVDAVLAPGPGAGKVAVLTSPEQPPEAVAAALVDRGAGTVRVAVCSRLGCSDESVTETNLAGVAASAWDPLSVVVVRSASRPTRPATLRWGGAEDGFVHRGGMITKAEVRAVALGKLSLPPVGVVWDVGAGSGSVAAEVAALAPGLDVFAVERNPADVSRIRRNVAGLGVTVVEGSAPVALGPLPDPDRVFVGGGGVGVLDVVLGRLRPGGTVVATFAALDHAVAAAGRLGHLVQISVGRGRPIGPDGALRLEAENPVFVCWGPDD